MKRDDRQRGFALVTVLMLLALMSALLAAHYMITRSDLSTTKSSMDRTQGFYAAEAGLNLRAQAIRERFQDFNRPSGTPPAITPGQLPCQTGPQGDGDYACVSYTFQDRDVRTYVVEDTANPVAMLIPPGEPYQNLNAQQYGYSVSSVAVNAAGQPEAILEMRFKNRLVPLFQFAAFYDKDLEVYPGPPMTLDGPVHCNGDLYAGTQDTLTLNGQVTVSHNGLGLGGRLFNGRKYDDCCSTAGARVFDGTGPRSLPSGAGRSQVTLPDQLAWNGWIRSNMEPVAVPPPDVLDPVAGKTYWDRADLRIMLDLDLDEVQVRRVDRTVDALATAALEACAGDTPAGKVVGRSTSLYNSRESTYVAMLEVDVDDLLDCLHANDLMDGKDIDDATDGGLVWYLGVEGPIPTGTVNNYGVRVFDGAELASNLVDAPEIQGLTVVTNQAIYIRGDYNSDPDEWKPAAFLADSINILSGHWDDAKSTLHKNHRPASDTEIYAAFLSGTDSTGNVELSPLDSFDSSIYNGGLENYPRLHESWTNKWLTYRGSFVSLDTPRHVQGSWDDQRDHYDPPRRDWRYDARFNNAANLPPLTPRFIYLTQELFVREFDY